AGVSFHTHSGVILRPFSTEPDDKMPAEDLWLYKMFGKKSTELTGYPNISIYHDFKYHPKQVITGGFDWIYEHMGQFMWTVGSWADGIAWACSAIRRPSTWSAKSSASRAGSRGRRSRCRSWSS